MAYDPHHFLKEHGDLSAYLAVGMLLPVLLLVGFGGAETVRAVGLRSAVSSIAFEALRTVEDQGGVSPALASSLDAQLRSLTGAAGVSVAGTAPAQPWGSTVCLRVFAPSQLWLPTGSLSVQLGGTFCGTSDLPPTGP